MDANTPENISMPTLQKISGHQPSRKNLDTNPPEKKSRHQPSRRKSRPQPSRNIWTPTLQKNLDADPTNDYVDFRPDSAAKDLEYVYPGDSWKRLQALKAKHDPTVMFKATKLPGSEEAAKIASTSLATGAMPAEMSQ